MPTGVASLLMDRFWSKVEKSDGCWVWTAARTSHGYGAFKLDGKMRTAHRVAYELEVGEIPEGLELDHLCRNRACVRPDHLEPVTHRENHLRGSEPTKTHCVNGHEYTEANTYMHNTRRNCRACHRDREARRRARTQP